MSLEKQLLDRFKSAQASFAIESLKTPSTRDAFEYGYRVGVVAGYEFSINILLSILDEEKNSDNNL
jgi:hypothetical protein